MKVHQYNILLDEISAPFYVAFEVISTCNLDCVYCYAKPFTQVTPSFAQIEFMFKKTAKEAKPFEVNILGGEPFLRDDIIDVLSLAKELFTHVGVSTNGTLIPKLLHTDMVELKRLNEKGLNIQVSLDSHIKDIHNKLRGGFDDVIKGLKRLDEYNIEYEVGIVVTRLNAEHILDTVKYIITNFKGVKRVHLMNLMPSYTLQPEVYDQLSLGEQTPEFWRTMVQKLEALKKIRGDVLIDYPLTPNAHIKALIDEMRGYNLCLAGVTKANVLANGDVTPCELVRNLRLGNLYKDSWSDIWEVSKRRMKEIARSYKEDEPIGLCALINYLSKKGEMRLQLSLDPRGV